MKCSSAKSVKCSTPAKNRATGPLAPRSLNSPEAACGPTKKGEDGNMEKLLIVDDDAALRRLMRLELSETYEVIDTGEPEQGLALALEHRPKAILLDLRMPKYSGYELCQTFTSFSRTQAIPVVIVSGEGGAQTKDHCKQLGAAAYFEKPLDFEALKLFLKGIVKTTRQIPRSEVRVRL